MNILPIVFTLVLHFIIVAAQSCEDTGCPNNGRCCMCLCNANDYAVSDFSCNCDHTPQQKPLPMNQQPHCCGGDTGFDAWCIKANTSSVKNYRCSNQTTAGMPTPLENFYQFSNGNYRCVYPPHTCNSGFCDNSPAPNLDKHRCHSTKPSPAPVPVACQVDKGKPDGCPCAHSQQCTSDWCHGNPAKCEKHPLVIFYHDLFFPDFKSGLHDCHLFKFKYFFFVLKT